MRNDPTQRRPQLTPTLKERELRRWYWTLAELRAFARELGVSASGRKADVLERIGAVLEQRPQPVSPRPATADRISLPLTRDTLIPPGQRATQELRQFFVAAVGSSFRFNGHMRQLLESGNITIGQAVDHWYATTGVELPEQSDSLEFNRFTKACHLAHPDGTPAKAREAWRRYRSLPADQRPLVPDA